LSPGGKGITIDIEKRKIVKYILFADLYFPEGIIDTIVPILIPVFLVKEGVPVEIATLSAAFGWIPWTIKFIWSGVIDKYSRYGRKTFVFIGSFIAVISFFILFLINPVTSIIPFTIFLFISQIGQSLHDSAADVWAIDVCKIKERGKINGAMAAGHTIGASSSVLLLGFVADSFGFNNIFLVAGLIVLILLIIPSIIKETKKKIIKEKVTPLIIKEFKNKSTILVALFAPAAVISGAIFMFGAPLYATNILNLSLSQLGLIAAAAPPFVIAGGLIGGAISDKWGRKKTYYIFAIPSIIVILSIMFTRVVLLLLIPYYINIFLQTARNSTARAMYMDVTNLKIGATQYSIFNSLSVISVVLTGMFAGTLIAILGYINIFIVGALVVIPPLIILYFINLNNNKSLSKIK
jgi:PAT family beta-lactamase induction signal transducer AmpG